MCAPSAISCDPVSPASRSAGPVIDKSKLQLEEGLSVGCGHVIGHVGKDWASNRCADIQSDWMRCSSMRVRQP